jgi:membrane-associated phospholipid phosphatase
MAQGRKARAKQKRALPQHLHQKQAEDHQLPAPVQMGGAPQTRRTFLSQLAGAAAAMTVADGVRGTMTAQAGPGAAPKLPDGTYAPLSVSALRKRRSAAFQMRVDRARHWHDLPMQIPLANDDELQYPSGWANFSKALLHDDLGHPDPEAFAALVHACTTGDPNDFAAIPLGGAQPIRNPQAGLSFECCGYDSNQTIVPPAPAFASAWRAGEMVEVYWAALLRDVPFAEYGTHPLVAQACYDLSRLSDFRGPKDGSLVTPYTIFRAPYTGAVDGPFISQFLLQDIAFGAQLNTQQVRVFVPGVDYLTTYADWLARQNGAPWDDRLYDTTFRYMRNGRDLAAWVDADPPLQAAYHALSILLQMGAPLDPASPYVSQITNQDAFTTFGPVEWFDLIGRAPRPAHEAVWFQKWRIHRSLRPEEYGGRVHNHLTGTLAYPLHADVLHSKAVQRTFDRYGTYLCAQAYPDGAPTHCAYPSGHSVGAGATITMLKAIFDERFVIPNPVEASADGLRLQDYDGPPLTVGGELNKLAFNIGMARVMAGIHWRSDVIEGNKLGQAVAISILQDMQPAYNEPFSGFTLTKFNGTTFQV